MPTLTIQLPGLPPVEHILRDEAITLGRMKGNTIAIDDVSVSLSHAKIIKVGDDYLLKDLNSTNGTMLNGQSVNEARLRNGDQLKFGEVLAVFRTELGRPAPAPAPAAAAVPAGPLTPTELPSAVAHTVTGLIPSSSAPAAAKRNAPPAAPQPAPNFPPPSGAPPGTPPPSPATPPRSGPSAPRAATSAPKASAPSIDKKKLVIWLAPILGGTCAAIVLGIVIWKSVSGSEQPTPTASEPAVKATNAPSSTKSSSANKKKPEPAKTNAPAVTKPAVTPKPTSSAPASTPPAQTTTPEVIPANATLADLVTVLRSPDVGLRRRAAQGISSFEGSAKDAIPSLRAALNDSDAEVRMWSALALVGNEVYDKVTIPILVDALKRDSITIRQTACIALALIPCEGSDKTLVVPALTGVANRDPSEDVRRDALTALRVIAPESIKSE